MRDIRQYALVAFTRRWRIAAVACGVLVALLLGIARVNDGIDRYRIQHGRDGVIGTLTLERIVEHSVGKPPPIDSWSGTFASNDGTVTRTVRLGEELPGGDDNGRPGQRVAVRWAEESPDRVYLAEGSRAFTNWLQSTVFIGVFAVVIAGIAVLVRRRRRSSDEAASA